MRRGRPACWLTTHEAVAECLVRHTGLLDATEAGDDAAAVADQAVGKVKRYATVRTGVVRRRKPSMVSLRRLAAALLHRDNYRAAERLGMVAVGMQVVLLLGALVAGAMFVVGQFEPPSPEATAVQRWIEEKHPGRIEISRCESPRPAPDGDGVVMRVRYHYVTRGNKRIETSQWFTIDDDRVVRVDSEL